MLYRLVTALMVGLLGVIGSGQSGEPAAPSIKIGMLATMFRGGKPVLFTALKKPFSSVVESQTGLDSKLVLVSNPDEMRQQLDDGKLQFCICHGFEFAWMKLKEPNLKPLMIAAPSFRPLKAFVVVAAASPAKSVDDLKGKSVALPNGIHETARLFADRKCECDDQHFFQEVTAPTNAETALHEVYDDKVQAAIVDGGALQCFAERYPARFHRLRMLAESLPFPMSVVVVREGAVDPSVVRRFKEGMVKANSTATGRQLMGLMHSSGFEVLPADYDKQLTEVVKSYPPPSDGAK